MTDSTKDKDGMSLAGVGLSEKDIYEAMKSIPGYLDITPADFKEIYCIAHMRAIERFMHSITARDLMTKAVVSIKRDAPLHEVAELMGSRGISGAPVIDADERVVGVISEKDFFFHMGPEHPKNFMTVIANCLVAHGCITLPIGAGRAEDIMTSPAITVREDAPLAEIFRTLSENSINRIPVTDSAGRLRGIVTRNDIVSVVMRSGTCSVDISGK